MFIFINNIFSNIIIDVFNIINQTTVPVDLWDGYIDYDVFDLTLDLEVGDIIREGETGATAEVVYYQRDGDQVRIYVKNVAGTFTFGTRYITGVAPASMFIYKQVGAVLTRIGTTESRQLADDDIGKLAVFQHTENLTIPPTLTYALNSETDEIADYEVEFITGVEYQTWIEEFKPGTSRVSLVPSTENNDWAEVNNIPINVGRDASSYTREGAFFVYKHNNETDQYDLVNGYILPNRETDRRLGKQVKLINNENFYKLAINSNESHANDAKQEVSPTGKGRIYFVINGQDEFGTYDWEQGRNKNFKGIYRNTSAYYVDQIVIYQDSFYKALTNLNNEEFDSNKWQLVSDHADFVGYVPNTSGFVFPGDDSSIVNLNTSDFGTVFDISESGSIFATIAKYSDGTSKLVIYRLTDSHFEYVTEFTAPVTSTGFGNAIAVSDNGNLIAVGASSTNTAQLKQGQIFVYKNVNGTFTLSQTLSYQSFGLNDYQFRVGNDILSEGNLNNLAYNVSLSRNSAGPSLIFPTNGSTFSISAKATVPYSLLNNKDYQSLVPAERFKWLEYYKILFKGKWYNSLAKKLVLMANTEVGYLGFYNKELGSTPFERFFVGGDGIAQFQLDGRESIGLRGYENNRLSSIEGGTIYNKFQLELRYSITDKPSASIYTIGFLEAGNSYDNFDSFNPFNLKRSAGVGIRIFMPAFGLLGIDFAHGFDPLPGSTIKSGWQTHFIIGQQF